MSYESINNQISFISFHTDYDQKTKNKMIKRLEKQLERLDELNS